MPVTRDQLIQSGALRVRPPAPLVVGDFVTLTGDDVYRVFNIDPARTVARIHCLVGTGTGWANVGDTIGVNAQHLTHIQPCTEGALMTKAQAKLHLWHQGLCPPVAPTTKSGRSPEDQIIDGLMGATIEQTVRADQLHALAMDFAVLCGELSKGLSPLDEEWIQLRDLGERLDALSQLVPVYMRHQREPLTDEQIELLFKAVDSQDKGRFAIVRGFARAIEAAHGIKLPNVGAKLETTAPAQN